MDSSASHRLFGVPELLEEILLQVDLPTLLTSAQRVCCMWYRVTQDSSALQKALFFKPSEKRVDPEERRINPFVESNLWHGLFRKRKQTHKRSPAQSEALPLLGPHEEEVYLRREASWRRMLPQQPPSNNITVVGPWYLDIRTLISSQLTLKPHRDCRRLGDLYSGIEKGVIFPAQDPFVFRFAVFSEILERELRSLWSTIPISKLLIDCDVVFFHMGWDPRYDSWNEFENWLWPLGKFEFTFGGGLYNNWDFGSPRVKYGSESTAIRLNCT